MKRYLPNYENRPFLFLIISLCILAFYFIVQNIAEYFFYFLVGIFLFFNKPGINHSEVSVELVNDMIPFAKLSGFLVAGFFVFLLIRLLMRNELFKSGNNFIGLYNTYDKYILFGLLSGIVLGLGYVIVVGLGNSNSSNQDYDLLVQMALSPGISRYCWILIVLFISPIIEELLYRGVLFCSINRTLGIHSSFVIVSLSFVMIHLNSNSFELFQFFTILLLSVIATLFRACSRYLWPSIAAHFGYNLVIVLRVSL